MSKFNWRHGFTIGLISGGGIVLLLWLSLETASPTIGKMPEPQAECGSTGYDCANDSEGVPDWWYWPRRLFAFEDTIAQWIMMFFTVIAAFFLWRTLVATQAMARDTREIGEAQVRPWLSFTETELDRFEIFPMQPSDIGAMVRVVFHVRSKITNTGNGAAIRARAYAFALATDEYDKHFQEIRTGQIVARFFSGAHGNFMLAPGSVEQFETHIMIDVPKGFVKRPNSFDINVCCTIKYDLFGVSSEHVTSQVFFVRNSQHLQMVSDFEKAMSDPKSVTLLGRDSNAT